MSAQEVQQRYELADEMLAQFLLSRATGEGPGVRALSTTSGPVQVSRRAEAQALSLTKDMACLWEVTSKDKPSG